MKKTYRKPAIRVVQLQQRTMLLSGSGVTNNVDINYSNLGSTEEAHSRRGNTWSFWDGEDDA